MGRKQRHHYLPIFYLEGFIDPTKDPYIWVYEKGCHNIIKSTAKDIAVQKDYYSFTNELGEKDSETYEDAFGDLESKAAPILHKIKNEQLLSDQEKGLFSFFIAYTMTRVPNYRKNIDDIAGKLIKTTIMRIASDREGFKHNLEKLEKIRGEKYVDKIDDFMKIILRNKYNIHTHPKFSLGMIGIAKDLAPIFYKMNWAFMKATDEYKFITSDNPLYYYDPKHEPRPFDGVGLLNANTEVCLPLSKDLMLLGTWKNYKGYYQLKNKDIRDINKRTTIFSLRFVLSSQRSCGISVLVQKYKNSHPKMIVI